MIKQIKHDSDIVVQIWIHKFYFKISFDYIYWC